MMSEYGISFICILIDCPRKYAVISQGREPSAAARSPKDKQPLFHSIMDGI